MKIAIVLHGNLRTFFMPIREAAGRRICDLIQSNIVEHNNADVFIVTDTTDFFYDGVQYFNDARRGQIKNKEADIAYHDVIDFMDSSSARALLQEKLSHFFRDRIKAMEIQDVLDVSLDPKFIILSENKDPGCFPDRLVNQNLKIKRGGELLREHEGNTGVRYDIIFRGRLDSLYGEAPLDIAGYDYHNYDIFVPGFVENLFVYDWAAFGNRKAMDIALNLYDKLGYTMDTPLFRCECLTCKAVHCGAKRQCKCNGEMGYSDMTCAIEYHLLRLFHDNGIRYSPAQYPMAPYRYRKS